MNLELFRLTLGVYFGISRNEMKSVEVHLHSEFSQMLCRSCLGSRQARAFVFVTWHASQAELRIFSEVRFPFFYCMLLFSMWWVRVVSRKQGCVMRRVAKETLL